MKKGILLSVIFLIFGMWLFIHTADKRDEKTSTKVEVIGKSKEYKSRYKSTKVYLAYTIKFKSIKTGKISVIDLSYERYNKLQVGKFYFMMLDYRYSGILQNNVFSKYNKIFFPISICIMVLSVFIFSILVAAITHDS